MWSLVAIANWSAISIHHVDYSRRRILMWVPSTPHRHFTTPAHLPHVSTACCLFLLLPLPSTTLQFSARQIAISAFYRWWLWPYPRCPPPSIFKRIEKEGGTDGPLHSDLSGCPILFSHPFGDNLGRWRSTRVTSPRHILNDWRRDGADFIRVEKNRKR